MDCMSFGDAVKCMEKGERVMRHGWNGKGMYIFHVNDWSYSHPFLKTDMKTNLPFLAMKTVQDEIIPWLASQTDMLAKDWWIV